jgi:hypothetical protein
MLLDFSVGNFRSFGEEVTLSFVSTSQKSRHGFLDETNRHTLEDGVSILLSAAVFGANASGKSNLFRALHFMKAFVLNSARDGQAGDAIDVVPFRLHPELRDAPSSFEVAFQLAEVRYRYGFKIDQSKVHSEWLFHTRKRERVVFSREGDDFKGLKSMGLEALGRMTRPNALFLSVAAQFNDQVAINILGWFKTLGFADGVYDFNKRFTARQLVEETPLATPIRGLLQRLDLDLSEVRTSKLERHHLPDDMPEELASIVVKGGNYNIETRHEVRDDAGQAQGEVWFDLEGDESGGTNKLFALAGPIADTLSRGGVAIIDEFDARLHSLIGRALIRLFHNPESNPRHAQLLIMTHDTHLLDKDLFRRDQIWFVEKKAKTGQSDLFSLAEIKERNDAAFEAGYLQGRYGAIPFPSGLAAAFREAAP